MPGFCGIQRQPHDLGSAHLADHQYVGILAQGVDDALLKTRRVRRYLTLPNEAAPIGEDIFERTLERDDISRTRGIALRDEWGKLAQFPSPGKSTTFSELFEEINASRARNIVTLES